MEISLRPWRMEDLPSILSFAGDREIARWLRDIFPHPYCRKDGEEFLRSCINAGDEEVFRAILADGQVVGSVALTRGTDVYHRSAELGYWLGQPFWGRGIMTRAVGQICLLGFTQWEICRIEAKPYADNSASRRVLEKCGFRLEGILCRSVCKWGEMHDSCIYGLVREG